jgi:hypothetical protein
VRHACALDFTKEAFGHHSMSLPITAPASCALQVLLKPEGPSVTWLRNRFHHRSPWASLKVVANNNCLPRVHCRCC